MSTYDRLNLSRRRFILLAASGLMTTALQGCGSPYDSSKIAPRLSQTIGDPAAAKRFGVSYLQDHPDEAGIKPLVERIDAGLIAEYGQGINSNDPQLLAVHLDRQIRNEYRRCETVRVDGWMLCPTEARLYALMALL